MNCQEVEGIITDLARGTVVNELALEHVKECRSCGERFADEERLDAGLMALSRSSVGEQAPDLVEAKLLREFRSRKRRTRKWAPAALAGSIAAAAVLARLYFTEAPKPPMATVAPPPRVVAKVEEAPVVATETPKPRLPRVRRVPQPVREPAPTPVEGEFLPIPQGDAWTPLDGGRLVRVSMPRSALVSIGLPIDEQRAMEPVQADVMLSNDGLLRAIRFVR